MRTYISKSVLIAIYIAVAIASSTFAQEEQKDPCADKNSITDPVVLADCSQKARERIFEMIKESGGLEGGALMPIQLDSSE